MAGFNESLWLLQAPFSTQFNLLKKMVSCCAIVVTYNPKIEQLQNTLKSLHSNCIPIIVIDNTCIQSIIDQISSSVSKLPDIQYISLKKNMGIAHAQNIGISHAISNNFEMVLLSDQDTIFPDDFLSKMKHELDILEATGEKIAAIGPAYQNTNAPELKPFFINYQNGSISKTTQNRGTIKASQIIASGMLIPTKSIAKVGMMNSDLFIDWVDLEWCWRAIKNGYSIYGTFNVHIEHQLGDKSKKLFNGIYTIHSPVRNYFYIRNGIHLSIRGKLLDEKRHRMHLIRRITRYFLGMILLSDHKTDDIKMMLRGFIDGIRGKLGPIR